MEVLFEFVSPVKLGTAWKIREHSALTDGWQEGLNWPNIGNDLQRRQSSVIPRYTRRGREETLRRLTDWMLSAFGISHLSCSVRPLASSAESKQQQDLQSAFTPKFNKPNSNHIDFYQNIWQCEVRTHIRLSTSLTIKKHSPLYPNQCRKCRNKQEKPICYNLTAGSESQQGWFAASYSVVNFTFFPVEHAKSSAGRKLSYSIVQAEEWREDLELKKTLLWHVHSAGAEAMEQKRSCTEKHGTTLGC